MEQIKRAAFARSVMVMSKASPNIDNSLNKAGYVDMPAGPGEPGDIASRDERNGESNSFPPPDCVDIASMDSFLCSDAPGYYAIRL